MEAVCLCTRLRFEFKNNKRGRRTEVRRKRQQHAIYITVSSIVPASISSYILLVGHQGAQYI
eukprot:scaffold2987_cov170-Amphora_coffeaeformis.AAC.30